MRNAVRKILSGFLAVLLMAGLLSVGVLAADTTEDPVQAVIDQLEAIDTLQQMQDKRRETIRNWDKYNVYTTDESIINRHETARAEYETYVDTMFAARLAAQQAYDALTAEQQSQIDPTLVAKLDDELDTVFDWRTRTLVPRYDEYSYEVVYDSGLCYETSNHIGAGYINSKGSLTGTEIPAMFLLVDTADGATSWTPDGLYVPGESNYEVVYCCDIQTGLKDGEHYKRVNLEDSSYYDPATARHIRKIVESSYPYITLDEMKDDLLAAGMSQAFVDSVNRSDVIAAVQFAIWAYANAYDDYISDMTRYGATYDVTRNAEGYMDPIHDYTNELWDWWMVGTGSASYDARAEYRVNMLKYYLCNLGEKEADSDEIVITDVDVARADLVPGTDDTYRLGMYVYLDGGSENDDITITATSYSTNEDGSLSVTATSGRRVNGDSEYEFTLRAKVGDTIKVEVEGTQYVSKGAYLYEPEGGRGTSQTLVGVSMGSTNVYAEETFTFEEDIEQGIRIYKTSTTDHKPISDITFSVYRVEPEEGETVGETPSAEEIAKYAVAENLAGSVKTDVSGYASLALDEGLYLVVEEHNTDKVLKPVDPFYVPIPMAVDSGRVNEDGSVIVEYLNVVSLYPKNTPTPPPDVPPPSPPPPPRVEGNFGVRKHDAEDNTILLEGAQFKVYRAATEEDTVTETVTSEGVEYAVVPVTVNGAEVILTTGKDGTAVSPMLPCGVYFVVETKAPSGYNLLEEAVSVMVSPSGVMEMQTVSIANERGVWLPETGGIGTTIFMVAGGVLVLAAVVLLVTKKRMKGSED